MSKSSPSRGYWRQNLTFSSLCRCVDHFNSAWLAPAVWVLCLLGSKIDYRFLCLKLQASPARELHMWNLLLNFQSMKTPRAPATSETAFTCVYTINSVLQRLNGEEWIRHLRVRLVTLVAGTNPNCRPLGITSLEKNKLIQMIEQIYAHQSICKKHWGLHMLQEKCTYFFFCL